MIGTPPIEPVRLVPSDPPRVRATGSTGKPKSWALTGPHGHIRPTPFGRIRGRLGRTSGMVPPVDVGSRYQPDATRRPPAGWAFPPSRSLCPNPPRIATRSNGSFIRKALTSTHGAGADSRFEAAVRPSLARRGAPAGAGPAAARRGGSGRSCDVGPATRRTGGAGGREGSRDPRGR